MDVVITGSTGMVGKSILDQCIKDDRVKNIPNKQIILGSKKL